MFTIEDLRNRKCRVRNNGTLHQIKAVLSAAFPLSKQFDNQQEFYFDDQYMEDIAWFCASDYDSINFQMTTSKDFNLPVQSVIDFYNQI